MARRRRRINRIKSLRDLDFSTPRLEVSSETKRWIIVILLIVFGLLALLSLVNKAGTLGVYFNNLLKVLFGAMRWYVPVILIMVGYFLWRPVKYGFKTANVLGLFVFIFGFNGLVHLIFHQPDLIPAARAGLGGGYSGLVFTWPLLKIMGALASGIVMFALSIIGFILFFETYFINILASREEREQAGKKLAL